MDKCSVNVLLKHLQANLKTYAQIKDKVKD